MEKALEREAKRIDDRFVVRDGRIAVVRSKPKHGAILGKLLPREVVKPVSEQGKWIQFEYYDWLKQEYQIGWGLKKYFKRVPATYHKDRPQTSSSNR